MVSWAYQSEYKNKTISILKRLDPFGEKLFFSVSKDDHGLYHPVWNANDEMLTVAHDGRRSHTLAVYENIYQKHLIMITFICSLVIDKIENRREDTGVYTEYQTGINDPDIVCYNPNDNRPIYETSRIVLIRYDEKISYKHWQRSANLPYVIDGTRSVHIIADKITTHICNIQNNISVYV